VKGGWGVCIKVDEDCGMAKATFPKMHEQTIRDDDE